MRNLNNIFKELDGKADNRFFGFGESPETDWKDIFVSVAILALLVTALNVFIFVRVDKGDVFMMEGSPEQSGRTLSLSELRETVSYYQSKAREFERIKNSGISGAVDPSI